jgi:probable phosphoglycerate mutase
MTRILLIRSGATDFDEQGRIKGTLDIPLSFEGTAQIVQLVKELADTPIDHLYASPCRCAMQSADVIAQARKLKVRKLLELQNLDHGLWHGKLIDEVKHSQPKVYRQLQERPETVCPPEGEPVGAALDRVRSALSKLLKKHKTGTIALVVPEPISSIVRSILAQCGLGDLWKVECEGGGWQGIDVQPAAAQAAWRGVPTA